MQNVYIIDTKIADVNGDKIPDTIYLVGEKKDFPFYQNIKVVVQDGKTLCRYEIPLFPEYSMAYNPWLFVGDFISSGASDIMVNLPVGGSGGLTYYYILSFMNNKAEYLLEPDSFIERSQGLKFEVVYRDDYRVEVRSKKLDQSYMLDVSDRKETYEETLYHINGKLIKPIEGFIIDLPLLTPIRFDGREPYKLQAQQQIAGTSRADGLGYIVTYWKYVSQEKTWVLDPEMFFVMI
jgi:hypothetical protein